MPSKTDLVIEKLRAKGPAVKLATFCKMDVFEHMGRNQHYQAAHNGQLPVIRIGKLFYVLTEPVVKMLLGENVAPNVQGGDEVDAEQPTSVQPMPTRKAVRK